MVLKLSTCRSARPRGHRGVFPSALAAVFLLLAGCLGEEPPLEKLEKHWPRFRGPGGLGVSDDVWIPVTWTWDVSAPVNVLWREPVPLPGASSPVVCGDRLFLTGADATKREIYCYDADTGDRLWRRSVVAPGGSPTQVDCWPDGTTYAAPTVAMDGVRVYAIFGNGDVACFDYENREVWVKNLGVPYNMTGHGSSLLVHGGLLLVQLDQEAVSGYQSRLLALNALTGKKVWEMKPAERLTECSLASPIIIDTADGKRLITCAIPDVIACDPATGQEKWRVNCDLSGYCIPSPIYAGGRVIVVKAYAKVITIMPDGEPGGWEYLSNAPYTTSPVGKDGLVFVMTDEGLVTCLDATDGTQLWEYNPFGSATTCYASPTIIGDRVYVLNIYGQAVVFEAIEGAYSEVGTGTLPGGPYYASPAVANGRMYIRGMNYLYCIADTSGG